jgi:soluble cytochrome b562
MTELDEVHRRIDRALEWYRNGNVDALSTAADVIHGLAIANMPRAISYFLEVAPDSVRMALPSLLRSLRVRGFLIRPPEIGYIAPEKSKEISAARQAVYSDIYDRFFDAVGRDLEEMPFDEMCERINWTLKCYRQGKMDAQSAAAEAIYEMAAANVPTAVPYFVEAAPDGVRLAAGLVLEKLKLQGFLVPPIEMDIIGQEKGKDIALARRPIYADIYDRVFAAVGRSDGARNDGDQNERVM